MATGKAALSKMSASARARALAAMASDADSGADEAPQKTIQPVASGLLAPSVATPGSTWQDFAGTYGDMGGIGALSGVHNSKLFDTMTNQIAKAIGFTGNRSTPGSYQFENSNEGGTFMDTAQGVQASPEFLQALENYRFSQSPTEQFKGAITDTAGQSVGSFTTGNKDTGFDKFANVAIPLALAALGGAAFGGYIPGAEIGAAGGGAASGAAAAGAADIGALGLAEGVYGAGGALGAGVAPGTVGGLAGSTAAFGGLGSVLPAGVGYGAAGAGALAGAAELASELAPSFDFGAIGQPQFTPSLSGGIEPFVQQLPTIGAETTAFGGLPELSTLAAGAPVETAFGSFGAGLLTPEVAATVAATQPTFNPEVLQTQNPFGGGLGPVAESVPSIAAETTAFGNLPELSALAAGSPVTTPFGSLGLPAAQPATSVLGTVKDTIGSAAQWMKDNPVLGRLIMSGATGLLSGAGGGSPSTPQTPSGPPVQWNSNLQQGLLSPVQQYAPPAVQQNRPAGLLAQGYANDGAWRYLKG
jgi:hypothetical protein